MERDFEKLRVNPPCLTASIVAASVKSTPALMDLLKDMEPPKEVVTVAVLSLEFYELVRG